MSERTALLGSDPPPDPPPTGDLLHPGPTKPPGAPGSSEGADSPDGSHSTDGSHSPEGARTPVGAERTERTEGTDRTEGAEGTGHTWTPARLPAGLLRTARPRQWVKNVLVVAAPVAAGRTLGPDALARLALVFVLFTCAASAVYLINDARDAEADRAHPVKCRRPVASGQVPAPAAYAAGAVLAVAAPLAAALLCGPLLAALLTGYVGMQLAYCVSLKHVLVVDLTVVTAGFVMRTMAGGLALGVPLSRWFLVTTAFGALFMVAAKRYSEAVQLAGRKGATRALLTEYTDGYLRFVWQLAAGAAVLAYCLWALDTSGSGAGLLPWRQLSMVAFTLAVLRYAVFADRAAAGEPEDVVLRDRPLAAIALLWLTLYGLAVVDR